MKHRLAVPILGAIVFATALPVAANAQTFSIESSRVCRDGDGDRVPCGRRVYRDRDNDREFYRERNRDRDRDGPGISIGRRGVRIDTE